MNTIDDRTRDAASRLRAHVAATSAADTDAAWRQLLDGTATSVRPMRPERDRRQALRWMSVGFAAALVVVAIVAVVVVRNDRDDVIPSDPTDSVVATTPGTTLPGVVVTVPTATTSPAEVTLPATTAPPGTATTSAGSPTTVEPTTVAATTVPPPAVPADVALPAGFVVASGTFTSDTDGWLVATAVSTEDSSSTANVLHTIDRGQQWTLVDVTGLSTDVQPRTITFADATNGWILANSGLVLATHDGGGTWAPVSDLPAEVYSIAAGNGVVHVVGFDESSTDFGVWTSPVDRDTMVQSPVQITPGAGPVADFQIVLRGDTGWIVYNDRVVTGGARLVDGTWTDWTPPCVNTTGVSSGPDDLLGPVTLAAPPTGTELVAVCVNSGFSGQPGNPHVFRSTDGGTTFTETVTRLPDGEGGTFIERGPVFAPADGTIAVVYANPQEALTLAVTVDDGATWTTAVTIGGDRAVGPAATIVLPDGTLAVPLRIDATDPTAPRPVAVESTDGGITWHEAPLSS